MTFLTMLSELVLVSLRCLSTFFYTKCILIRHLCLKKQIIVKDDILVECFIANILNRPFQIWLQNALVIYCSFYSFVRGKWEKNSNQNNWLVIVYDPLVLLRFYNGVNMKLKRREIEVWLFKWQCLNKHRGLYDPRS